MDQLVLGGRPVAGVGDKVRRYCGLPWSGGGPETWAYRYYDLVDTDPRVVGPVDVLAAGALHPGLSRHDLAFFVERAEVVDKWLAALPLSTSLDAAGDDVLARLAEPLEWPEAPGLALLSKVLHRKRPALVPLVDRHVLDWYRPRTGERSATAAWRPLLRLLRDDLVSPNASVLHDLQARLAKELANAPTPLRLVDIALWMSARP